MRKIATRAKNKVRRFDRRIVQLAVPTRNRLLQHCDKDHRSHDSGPDYFHRGGERAIIRHLDGRHLKTRRWRTELFYRRLDFNENIISSFRVATFPILRLHYRKASLLFNRVLSNLRSHEIITEETKRTQRIYTNYYIIGVS